MLNTGADMNAWSRKTLKTLFLDVELQSLNTTIEYCKKSCQTNGQIQVFLTLKV